MLSVYKLVAELLSKDLGARKVEKAAKEVKSLIGVILGDLTVCWNKDMSKWKLFKFNYRSQIWLVSGRMGTSFKAFLPVTSDEICEEISVRASPVIFLARSSCSNCSWIYQWGIGDWSWKGAKSLAWKLSCELLLLRFSIA